MSHAAPGEMALARQTAETFLREAKAESRLAATAVAIRILGLTCFWQDEFVAGKAHLEAALLWHRALPPS